MSRWRVLGLLFVVGVALASGGAWASGSCPAGLVGYWPLDTDGTEVVHQFPGALIGNVSFASGVVGQSASFDGNGSYIDAGFQPALSAFGGNQLTFSAWLNPLEDPQAGNPIDGNDTDSAVINARTFCNEGNWQFYEAIGSRLYISKWYQGDESFLQSSISLPEGVWSHVAVTYNNGVARFYVNGQFEEEVTDDLIGPINALTQNVQIGHDSCSSFFTGRIDELAVYSVALTDQQVADLYEGGIEGNPICTQDADGDGVPDDQDVCPGTSGEALVDGCDCDQILAYKPGNGGQCNAGTLNVFARRIGWARNVPLPGQ
jgi:Concanavalin A-like lectin/glucanases superfamily/Thrombospondin type 3 repeat